VAYAREENAMKTVRSWKKKVMCRERRNNSATRIAQFYDFLKLEKKKHSFLKDVKVRNKISNTACSLEFYDEGAVSSPSCWYKSMAVTDVIVIRY